MSDNIPDWLKSSQSDNAYMPSSDFIQKLDPQSRLEALLKYQFADAVNRLRNGG